MTDEEFHNYLDKFINHLNELGAEHTRKNYPSLKPDKYVAEAGKKYIRVIMRRGDADAGGSAHCFIVNQDNETKALGKVKRGDVLMAKSWKAPAKHVRGTILTDDPSQYGVGVYGARYLR